MTATERINQHLGSDLERLADLMDKYPFNIPNKAAAEFLHISEQAYRAFLETGKAGMAWRQEGKLNKAYDTPTCKFARWYLGEDTLEGVN